MSAIKDIPTIDDGSLQLLEAIGIHKTAELAGWDPAALTKEMIRANELLSLAETTPDEATVGGWVATAREATGFEEPAPVKLDKPEAAPAFNYEEHAEIAEILTRSPYAIPLPGKVIVEKGLGVSDVPEGLLLNHYAGNLDIRVGDPNIPRADLPTRRNAVKIETAPTATVRKQFDASAAKPIATAATKGPRVPVSKSGHEEDRVALMRAPRAETNRGKNPESRRYIRGVLHPNPWRLRLGAVSALLLLANVPLAVVSAFLLLASREVPQSFGWVPEWFLVFPAALPLTGAAYLIWGFIGRCRICNQKLFIHKRALKHIKAHRIPGFGYVVPLSLHLLSFSWFRCSSCGTPVRLKK